MNRLAVVTAAALILVSGLVHGALSHRWTEWTGASSRASLDRIEQIPLRFGDWDGQRVELDPLELPEDVVGRGVSVRYTNRTTGQTVLAYLSCGPTDGQVSHTPRVCYPANGYLCPVADLRVSPTAGTLSAEFWTSHFYKPAGAVEPHLRVLWAWSDGRGWQVPANARRTFRSQPVIYKCYVIRPVAPPDEPLDGDPGVRFLGDFLPALDPILAPGT